MEEKDRSVIITPLLAPPTASAVRNSLSPHSGFINSFKQKLLDEYRKKFNEELSARSVLIALKEFRIVGDENKPKTRKEKSDSAMKRDQCKYKGRGSQIPESIESVSIHDLKTGRPNTILSETQFTQEVEEPRMKSSNSPSFKASNSFKRELSIPNGSRNARDKTCHNQEFQNDANNVEPKCIHGKGVVRIVDSRSMSEPRLERFKIPDDIPTACEFKLPKYDPKLSRMTLSQDSNLNHSNKDVSLNRYPKQFKYVSLPNHQTSTSFCADRNQNCHIVHSERGNTSLSYSNAAPRLDHGSGSHYIPRKEFLLAYSQESSLIPECSEVNFDRMNSIASYNCEDFLEKSNHQDPQPNCSGIIKTDHSRLENITVNDKNDQFAKNVSEKREATNKIEIHSVINIPKRYNSLKNIVDSKVESAEISNSPRCKMEIDKQLSENVPLLQNEERAYLDHTKDRLTMRLSQRQLLNQVGDSNNTLESAYQSPICDRSKSSSKNSDPQSCFRINLPDLFKRKTTEATSEIQDNDGMSSILDRKKGRYTLEEDEDDIIMQPIGFSSEENYLPASESAHSEIDKAENQIADFSEHKHKIISVLENFQPANSVKESLKQFENSNKVNIETNMISSFKRSRELETSSEIHSDCKIKSSSKNNMLGNSIDPLKQSSKLSEFYMEHSGVSKRGKSQTTTSEIQTDNLLSSFDKNNRMLSDVNFLHYPVVQYSNFAPLSSFRINELGVKKSTKVETITSEYNAIVEANSSLEKEKVSSLTRASQEREESVDIISQFSNDWCISEDFIETMFGTKETKKQVDDVKISAVEILPEVTALQEEDVITKKNSINNNKIVKPNSTKRTTKKMKQNFKTLRNKKITDYITNFTKGNKEQGIEGNISEMKENDPPKPKCEKVKDDKTKRKHPDTICCGRKKTKFCTPYVSHYQEIEPVYDVILLKDHIALQLFQSLSTKVPKEICFDLIFEQQYCQLSKSSTCKKEATPIGLLFGIQWGKDDDPDFYYMSAFSGWSNAQNARQLIMALFSPELPARKVCYDAKQIYLYVMDALDIEEYEVEMVWHVWDVMIGCWLINPDQPSASFGGALNILNVENNKKVITSDPIVGGCYLLKLLSKCAENMYAMLVTRKIWQVFYDIEMNIVSCLAAMERRGIMVSENHLLSNSIILEERLSKIHKDAYNAAGKEFKLNSTVEVRKLLFEELQLDKISGCMVGVTATLKEKSTSEETLLLLKNTHPLPKQILEYRHAHKAKSTYVDAISRFSSNNIVRAKWLQTGTSTGRISCNNPNLQAIPKHYFHLVLFPSENNPQLPHLNLRSAFTARNGYTFVSADFRHIEFRLFANLAEDEGLLRLVEESEDVFISLGNLLKDVGISVGSGDREKTKKLVYAAVYGAGLSKMREILDCSYEEAKIVQKRLSDRFRAFNTFGHSLVTQAQRQGYLSSLSGRRRLFPNIKSGNMNLRKQAERQAINFMIQGSAADVCKAVMVEVETFLRKKYTGEYYLLLQIHDELVWEVREQFLTPIIDDLRKLLEDGKKLCKKFTRLRVSLPVSISVGKKWGELQKISN